MHTFFFHAHYYWLNPQTCISATFTHAAFPSSPPAFSQEGAASEQEPELIFREPSTSDFPLWEPSNSRGNLLGSTVMWMKARILLEGLEHLSWPFFFSFSFFLMHLSPPSVQHPINAFPNVSNAAFWFTQIKKNIYSHDNQTFIDHIRLAGRCSAL